MTHPTSVAIIGGGIAGVAAAKQLAATLPDSPNQITLYEIGRGPGGRSATRRTRSIPDFRINHGVPYADISTREGMAVISSLGQSVQPYVGKRAVIDGKSGTVVEREVNKDVQLVVGANGEMANIAASLLPNITTAYSTMVRGLARGTGANEPWILYDKQQAELGRADWLIVAGSGIAHPRWSETFGGPPPLVEAAAKLNDPALNESLAVIGKQTAAPVLAVLFYATGAAAQAWQRLSFDVATIRDHDVLAKISIQPCGPTGCSVVLYSTSRFARENTGVYGSSSSAARVGDASSSADREESIIDEMLAGLERIPGMPIIAKSVYPFGPLLHRWGNAFPQGEPLPAALSVCHDARVAFCGDYVSTPARMGSYECALLSGFNVARHVIDALGCHQT